MSASPTRKLAAGLAAAALMVSSTGAAAASPAASAQPVDPWLALTAMSSTSSTAAASAAVAQSDVGRTARANAGFRAPPIPALAVILATLAVALYILLDDNGPRSPD